MFSLVHIPYPYSGGIAASPPMNCNSSPTARLASRRSSLNSWGLRPVFTLMTNRSYWRSSTPTLRQTGQSRPAYRSSCCLELFHQLLFELIVTKEDNHRTDQKIVGCIQAQLSLPITCRQRVGRKPNPLPILVT